MEQIIRNKFHVHLLYIIFLVDESKTVSRHFPQPSDQKQDKMSPVMPNDHSKRALQFDIYVYYTSSD
jgi:hypothetical protein